MAIYNMNLVIVRQDATAAMEINWLAGGNAGVINELTHWLHMDLPHTGNFMFGNANALTVGDVYHVWGWVVGAAGQNFGGGWVHYDHVTNIAGLDRLVFRKPEKSAKVLKISRRTDKDENPNRKKLLDVKILTGVKV